MAPRLEEASPRFVKVADAREVPPGSFKAVGLARKRLIIVNLGEEYRAFDARCPHQGGPLEEGTLFQSVLTCPWHHWTFDVSTGENIFPRNVFPSERLSDIRGLKVYPVRLRGHDIQVALPARGIR